MRTKDVKVEAHSGGDFAALPPGHAECQPGFVPYRCADGRFIGVQICNNA